MPLFISDEEFERCAHDPILVADKADAYIRELHAKLDTVKAKADAASITAEQNCAFIEQKYVAISVEFTNLQDEKNQLVAQLDERKADIAKLEDEKRQIELQSITKDGEIERLTIEASELHKSKRQLLELLSQKDVEISEKNSTIKSYLDKIVNLTDGSATREARLSDLESELAHCRAASARLSQEKELVERHNTWLNDELTAKVDCVIELRKTHSELEADLSGRLADVEKKFNESSISLKWNENRVKELESKLRTLQEELVASKDAAAAAEERFSAELSTVNRLVELYKESSEEWSKKAGELEGVIKALETHLCQTENDYKERLENEVSAKKEIEKEATTLKEKIETCEAELERRRKDDELKHLPLSSFTSQILENPVEGREMVQEDRMLVPSIPGGVSGTALAASLLRDGWSLAKMYAKYQEAVDALRHEQMGRKQAQAILERVLYEIEEKATVIMDERAEHDRLAEAYSALNEKLQDSHNEQAILERTIQELKADLRRHERDNVAAQKEIVDLQNQVAVLLKECRDIQLRCGSAGQDYGGAMTYPAGLLTVESDVENIISERLLTFKDISGLVEQNVQLRSVARRLTDEIENKETELKEVFEKELQKHTDEAASKVNTIIMRAEEQGRMIESLHSSVAMYKKLYEEEHKHRSSTSQPQEAGKEEGRMDVMLLIEDSHEASRRAQEQSSERVKRLEDDLAKLRSEMLSLRSERDKLSLEAQFAQEKLDRYMKEFEHQREEHNRVLARNVEFSQLIIDYQRKLRESSESLDAAQEQSRKSAMEVSILKQEKEILLSSEKRASDEIRNLSERVHRLQASLNTIQSTEEVREEARTMERKKQEDYIKQIEREWAEAKKELQEERDNNRRFTHEREDNMKNALRQVEEMGKELANALGAVAAAEARASAAEGQCSALEERIKMLQTKVSVADGEHLISSGNEAVMDLLTARQEIEKLREETVVNKNHMLQYKSIAQVNEEALKQMEMAHENLKIEADKVKSSLEQEVQSLRERVNELEKECRVKSEEAASLAAAKEEALAAALSEIASLKEDQSAKMSQTVLLDTRISALKDELEEQHKKWRSAQTNYERQIILQSETIQELTRTSQALASLQEEASELRRVADKLKSENNDLKATWEAEKLAMEGSKNESERKYKEVDEQNKILHARLEALHIKLAEKERHSLGKPSESTSENRIGDDGLQDVVNYLRRSKEIAETEISLLKQEKLRLQSQLESALKAAELAQASLNDERTKSRALLFTEEDFKSLQLQVREMNLLRESNMQLREENKHNFEECQKLRESHQKARMEIESLENLLRMKQNEIDAGRKEFEMQKIKEELLQKRVDELLERSKNFDVEDYDRVKEALQTMQVTLKEKDVQLEESKKLIAEKSEVMAQLEQDLSRSRLELSERETRINELLQVEASLKSDVEKQRKFIIQLKKKHESLLREKEELSKQNQILSKQLEDAKQEKRVMADAAGEQAMKEKEKEKDTRIQILEKTLERMREELRKEKDENKVEKNKRLKAQKTISDSVNVMSEGKSKLVDELEKHKHALKTLTEEVEKLKQARGIQSEGTSVGHLLSNSLLEDLTAAYLSNVENFGKVAQAVRNDLGTASEPSSTVDNSSARSSVAPPALGLVTPGAPAMASEERGKRLTLPKANVETRKMGRKLVRPRIVKPEEPHVDVDMSETDAANSTVKPETQAPPLVRKRPSASDSQDESLTPEEVSTDVGAPLLKKSKNSENPQEGIEGIEGQSIARMEVPDIQPAMEESIDDAGEPQDHKKDTVGADDDETETAEDQGEEAMLDRMSPAENDRTEGTDEGFDKPSEAMVSDDQLTGQTQDDNQQPTPEYGSEREEGELDADIADVEGGSSVYDTMGSPEIRELQAEHGTAPDNSPGPSEEPSAPTTMDVSEVDADQVLDEEKNDEGDVTDETVDNPDKPNEANDQVVAETDRVPEAASTGDKAVSGTTEPDAAKQAGAESDAAKQSGAESDAAKQAGASGTAGAADEGKAPADEGKAPVTRPSTVINLGVRAKEKARVRQAALQSPSPSRGRGRPVSRGRVARGGRSGRGQAPGSQG